MDVLREGLAFAPADRPTAAEFRDRLAALDVGGPGGNLRRSGSTAMEGRRPAGGWP